MNIRFNVVERSRPHFGWVEMISRISFTLALPTSNLNSFRGAALSHYEMGRLSLPFLCLFLARILIFLLLLISGNVYPNPGPVFLCSVCTGSVIWRSRSAQCSTCSTRVHLRCSPLFYSKFNALGSSHSWSCSPCCVSASRGPQTSSTVTSSLRNPLLRIPSLFNLVN